MTRSEISARCADEIMALEQFGSLDKGTLEHIITTYLLETEQAAFERFMDDLGKAFKERAEGGRG